MLDINNRIDDSFTYFEESVAEMTGSWPKLRNTALHGLLTKQQHGEAQISRMKKDGFCHIITSVLN